MSEYYRLSTKEVCKQQRTDKEKGLSSVEAKRRLDEYGPNILNIKKTSIFRKIIEPFCDLFMVILVVALVLAIIQGSKAEVFLITIDIVCDALIFYIQDFSTERILRNLRKESAQKSSVIRDGKEIEIDASELVPGDIVILREGHRVPADGRIIEESGVLTNESMLTGESDSVIKDSRVINAEKKVYEQKNMVFAGSFVVTGLGKMIVTATSNNTEYGRIASLASLTTANSPIQEKINKLVIKIAITILIVAAFVLAIQIIQGMNFFEAAEFTLALVVSAVPEDLPIATAIILAIGASRMAKKKALVRELRAIESIGIVSTVFSDKTGTLTENRLAVNEVWSKSGTDNIGDILIKTTLPNGNSLDSMDECFHKYAKSERIVYPKDIIHSYAFDQSIRMSGNLILEKKKAVLYVKGAPEVVLKRCELSEKEYERVNLKLSQMSQMGYKVLAIASVVPKHEINELSRLGSTEKMKFFGLVAVSDTIRREAKSAIYEAEQSGVKVKMITGDHAGTAFFIGKKLGLVKKQSEVFDCSKMSQMDEPELKEKIRNAVIFARVLPEDKFRIVEIMKNNEVVAMTGDGVNDVPALRSAHIGIAMGDGAQIVQDASDIVLTDNNFKSITEAIKEGRIILSNIRRMLIYLLATNAGEVLVEILSLLISRTQLLFPIQILWINLVTDSIMIIPIGLEPAEKAVLLEKPESPSAPILSREYIMRIVIMAVTMSVVTLLVYYLSLNFLDEKIANSLAFLSLVVMQWANALNVRGLKESVIKRIKTKNFLFLLALVFAMGLQILASFGGLMKFVSTVTIPVLPFIITVIFSFILPIVTVEIQKKWFLRRNKRCKKYSKK